MDKITKNTELVKLKQALTRWDQGEFLHLADAAHIMSMSEKYLLRLIRDGKLKALKLGDHWLIKLEWLKEWRDSVRHSLHQEIAAHHAKHGHSQGIISGFVKNLSAAEACRPKNLFFSWQNIPLILSLLLTVLSLYFWIGTAVVPLTQIAYRSAHSVGWRISDERLTQDIFGLVGRLPLGPRGRVVGEFEGQIK